MEKESNNDDIDIGTDNISMKESMNKILYSKTGILNIGASCFIKSIIIASKDKAEYPMIV